MPIEILKSTQSSLSTEELIEDALRRLHGIPGTDIPDNPDIRTDRQWISRTCHEYKTICGMPGISKSRATLRSMAKAAAKLAKHFRNEMNALYLGAATENPEDAPEKFEEKKQEIRSAQEELITAADELDRVAVRLNERAARWDGKKTGQISTAYAMAFGNPQKWLADEATAKFFERRPDALNISRGGDYYTFVCLLHEIAMGSEPDGLELHHPCQDAVKAVRR